MEGHIKVWVAVLYVIWLLPMLLRCLTKQGVSRRIDDQGCMSVLLGRSIDSSSTVGLRRI
jgi:hypothetical protein